MICKRNSINLINYILYVLSNVINSKYSGFKTDSVIRFLYLKGKNIDENQPQFIR